MVAEEETGSRLTRSQRPTDISPVELPPQLSGRLRDLRRRLSRAGLFLITLILLGGISGYLVVAGILDRTIRFSEPGCWGLFAGLVGILLMLGGVSVFLRRRWRPSLFQLAHRLESLFPELGGDLLGTVELCHREHPETEPVSSGMIRSHAVETGRRTAAMDFSRVIPRRKLRSYRRAAAFPLAAFLLYAAVCPRYFGNSLLRIALPFLEIEPYTRTHLEVEPGDSIFARGTDLPIDITCRGDIPRQAVVEYSFAQPGGESERNHAWQKAILDPTSAGHFRHVIPAPKENVRYRVFAGDARSPLFLARAVDRSQVAQIDLHYRYPRYTGLPARDEQGSAGTIAGPEGTEVVASIRASGIPMSASFTDVDGRVRPMLQTTGDSFEATLLVKESGTYEIILEDQFGPNHGAAFRREVQAVPDKPPTIRILRPDRQSSALGHTAVPLEFQVTDEYGVDRVWLSYRIARGPTEKEGEQALIEKAARREIRETKTWDLAELALEPGDTVTYRVHASDRRPPSGQEGLSAEHTLRIASPFEELARLESLQDKILERLSSLQNRERQLQEAWDTLERATEQAREVILAERLAMESAADSQQRIASEAREVLEDYKQLRTSTLEHPHLSDDLAPRVSELTEAMRRLAEEDLLRAAARMRDAASLAQSPNSDAVAGRKEAVGDAQSSLENILQDLQNLERATAAMPKTQTALSFLNAARQIEDRQKQIGKEMDDHLLREAGQNTTSDESREESGKRAASVAARQDSLARDFEHLRNEFANPNRQEGKPATLNRQREPASPAISWADRLLSQETVPQGMHRAADDLRRGRMHRALAQEDQVEEWLEGVREGLEELADMRPQPSPSEGKEAVDELLENTDRLRDLQETMKREMESLSPGDSQRSEQIAELESKLAEWARELEPLCRSASKNWLVLPSAAGEQLRRAAEDMEQASRALSDPKGAKAPGKAESALQRVQNSQAAMGRAQEWLEQAAAYQMAARALTDLGRMESRQNALQARTEEVESSLAGQPSASGETSSEAQKARLQRLAEEGLRLADELRKMASRAPEATGQSREECAHSPRLSSLAQGLTDAAGSMQKGEPPGESEQMHGEIRSAFRDLRRDLASAMSATAMAMQRAAAWRPGGGPARSGYRFAPGAPGEEAPNDAFAVDQSSDSWATLPAAELAELEKNAGERFSGNFAALLQAYYRRLAQDVKQ